jgi:hypothetical protein
VTPYHLLALCERSSIESESLALYRDGRGLSTEGVIGTEFEDGAVVFFNLNDDSRWDTTSTRKRMLMR